MRKFSALLVLSTMIISCSTSVEIPDQKTIGMEGFLNETEFQVLIKSEPETGVRGLVKERESALKNGQKDIFESVALKIYTLCSKNILMNKKFSKDQEKILLPELRNIAIEGKTLAVYYLEDNSALFIYRIRSKGLRKKIESIFTKIKTIKQKS